MKRRQKFGNSCWFLPLKILFNKAPSIYPTKQSIELVQGNSLRRVMKKERQKMLLDMCLMMNNKQRNCLETSSPGGSMKTQWRNASKKMRTHLNDEMLKNSEFSFFPSWPSRRVWEIVLLKKLIRSSSTEDKRVATQGMFSTAKLQKKSFQNDCEREERTHKNQFETSKQSHHQTSTHNNT